MVTIKERTAPTAQSNCGFRPNAVILFHQEGLSGPQAGGFRPVLKGVQFYGVASGRLSDNPLLNSGGIIGIRGWGGTPVASMTGLQHRHIRWLEAMDALSAAQIIEMRLAEAAVLGPLTGELQRLSIDVGLTYCEPTPNTALRLDLDGKNALGSLTWWSDGSLFLEAIRISDEATLLRQHGNAATAAEVAEALLRLAGAIGG